jgi:serine/threonine protein phosphatase PrpC
MADNFFGATDTGRIRDNNEDAFIAQSILSGKYILACAIDGVGGYEGGEIAAALARDTIIEVMSLPFEDVDKTLHAALRFANARIFEEKETGNGNANMACVLTLVLADLSNNKFHYAHIGDTRLYLLRDHSLVKVTKDHSFVGYLEDSGRLTEESAMNHPKRNEINKALGFDPHLHTKPDSFDIDSSPFLPGDILMLCSDGLSDLVNSAQMVSILTSADSLQQKATRLIKAANDAGGKDNITVVLVHNDKERIKHDATKPTVDKTTRELPKYKEPTPDTSARTRETPVVALGEKKKFSPVLGAAILVLLCLIAVAIWYFTRNKKEEIVVPAAVTPMIKSPLETALNDSIAVGGNLQYLHVAVNDTVITITDTVFINRDSLHINGNGIVLHADSSFGGPVFFLYPNAVHIVLENIIFRNFSVAIISGSKGLHLRNVKFQNCDVPVQYNFLLPQDQSISGLMNDSFLSQNDSGSSKLWR